MDDRRNRLSQSIYSKRRTLRHTPELLGLRGNSHQKDGVVMKKCIYCLGSPRTCFRCVSGKYDQPIEYAFWGIVIMIAFVLLVAYVGMTHS